MISYAALWRTMKQKNISTYTLTEKHNIGNYTLTRMRRNKHVSTRTLEDLCTILDCEIQDVIEIIKEKNAE